jgi:hypothetical protein
LFISASLATTYFLAEEVVPNKPGSIWLAMLGAATGIIPVGFIVFKHIEDDDRNTRNPSRYHSEQAAQMNFGDCSRKFRE